MKSQQAGYRVSNLKITTNPFETDNGLPKSEAVYAILQNLQLKVAEQGIGARSEVLKYMEQHPDYPEFKNLLATCYAQSGMLEKANEANLWIRKEHPDYFFGKINYVHQLMAEKRFEEAEKELTEHFSLEDFLPNRKVFHVTEFEGFESAVIRYYIATKQFDMARNRLESVVDAFYHEEQIDQLFILLEDAEELERNVAKVLKISGFLKKYVQYDIEKNPDRPILNFPKELECLFQTTIRTLDFADLETILALPRVPLIADLKALLWDTVHRMATGRDFAEEDEMHLHAWMLLGELCAEEALPALLDVLRLEEDYLEPMFQDLNHDILWWSFSRMNLLEHQELLMDFALDASINPFNRCIAFQGIPYIGLLNADKRAACVDFLVEVVERSTQNYIAGTEEDDDFPFLTCNFILDLQAKEKLPLFKKLLHQLPSLKADFKNISNIAAELESPFSDHCDGLAWDTIFIAYKHIRTKWYPTEEEWAVEKARMEARLLTLDAEAEAKKAKAKIKTQNVGRNEPCPCGSGKKFKRCCGN